MWQDIVAVGIVFGTIALIAYRAIRRRRRGIVGGCSACHSSEGSSPRPSYLIPSDSLTSFRPVSHEPSDRR